MSLLLQKERGDQAFQLTKKGEEQRKESRNEPSDETSKANHLKCRILTARIITTIVMCLIWSVRLVRITINISMYASTPGFNKTHSLISSNMSNVSLECPAMYILDQGLCEPQCGEWGGCGSNLLIAETWLLRIISVAFLLLSLFTFLTWLIAAEGRRSKYIPNFIMVLTGVLLSVCFCYWDLPGAYTSYCLRRDSSWYSVLDSYSYVSVLVLLTQLMYFCVVLWLGISLLNLNLRLYCNHSKKIGSSRCLILSELAVGVMVGAAWGVILHVTGKGYDVSDIILTPRDANTLGIVVSETLFSLMAGCINTLGILVIHHIRTSFITRKEQKLSELDKRLVCMYIGYLVITLLQAVLYILDERVNGSVEERVSAYSSCVTADQLASKGNSTTSMTVPNCSEPCVLPLRPLVLRAGLMAVFLITSVHSTARCWREKREEREESTNSSKSL